MSAWDWGAVSLLLLAWVTIWMLVGRMRTLQAQNPQTLEYEVTLLQNELVRVRKQRDKLLAYVMAEERKQNGGGIDWDAYRDGRSALAEAKQEVIRRRKGPVLRRKDPEDAA